MTVSGSCLCGQIRYELHGDDLRSSFLYQCHCSRCRQVTGSAANAVLVIPERNFRWLAGDDLVKHYRPESGSGASFCPECSSPAPFSDESGRTYWIPAGGLDSDIGLKVGAHMFTGSKAGWDEFSGPGQCFDEGMS